MPKQKKEKLVHFDIDTLAQQTKQKEPAPASLGETLRAKREKKKLSTEDVAAKLCIKEIYIKALEEGHYYAFPNRVYGIGFLRTYSKFLGLDSDLMVTAFHAETSDLKEAPLDMPVIEKHFALPSKKTLGIVALILLGIIIAWFTLAALISSDLFSQLPEPKQEESVVEEVITAPAPVIADEVLTEAEKVQPEVKEEAAPAPEAKKEKAISEEALTAKVAFIAKGEVWVRLYNTKTQKVIVDKVFQKNDSFVPESDLADLELTTARAGLFALYSNGKELKTFALTKGLPLSSFAPKEEAPETQD